MARYVLFSELTCILFSSSHHHTNLVLGGLHAKLQPNHTQSKLLRPIPILPRKKVASPRIKRLKKKNPRYKPPSACGSVSRLPDVELETYTSKVDGNSSLKAWIRESPFSSANSDTRSTNSFKTSKSLDTTASRKASTPNPDSNTNFLSLPQKSQSNPSIDQPINKSNSEFDICQIKISESPTIPYIDDDSSIKSAIEQFVYQDPVTRAVVPKSTSKHLEERPLLVTKNRDANANKFNNLGQQLLKPHFSFQDNERDYYSS